MQLPKHIVDEIFAEPKKRKKEALRNLFNRYGSSASDIDNLSDTDWYTYLMNKDVEEEVRAEMAAEAALPKTVRASHIGEIKSALSNLGYYTGDIDDIKTPGYDKAINDFIADNQDIDTDDEENRQQQLLEKLRGIQNPSRLDFDGKNLRWIENGKVLLELDAQSGRSDYQDRKYQDVKAKGPLPEGSYRVRQSDVQDIENTFLERLGRGKAPGGYKSWGKHRVWLQPFDSNTMYDRNRLTIHGGNELGSAGCIDIGRRDERFFNVFKKYGKDVILNVKYPKDKLR